VQTGDDAPARGKQVFVSMYGAGMGVVTELLHQKELMDANVCGYVVEQIDKQSTKQTLTTSLLVLLVLLFSSILAVLLWAAVFAGIVLVFLLRLTRIYRKKKIQKTVDILD